MLEASAYTTWLVDCGRRASDVRPIVVRADVACAPKTAIQIVPDPDSAVVLRQTVAGTNVPQDASSRSCRPVSFATRSRQPPLTAESNVFVQLVPPFVLRKTPVRVTA